MSQPGVKSEVHEAVVREHLEALADLALAVARDMAPQIVALAARVESALRGGGKVLFCGNGGSAADAQHLAAEYVVRFQRTRAPLAAIALTTDTSVLTAAGNDMGFETVFERQVQALARPGDLLVLLSTSGVSRNVVRAAQAARIMGVATAALVARDGGPLKDAVDLALVVPTDTTSRAQEVQIAVGHAVVDLVERSFVERP